MAYAKITLIGAINYFDNYNEDLFEFLRLPEGLDREILIDDLVYRAGDFELLHINPEFTRYSIGAFCNKWADTWQHWYDVLMEEYDPLYNVDRHEEITDRHTGTQNNALTGSDSKANTGTQTMKNTGTQTTADTGTQATATTDKNNTESNTTGTKANVNAVQNGTRNTTHGGRDSGTQPKHEVYAYNQVDLVDAPSPYYQDTTMTAYGHTIDETENRVVSDTGTDTGTAVTASEGTTSETRTDNLQSQRTDNLTGTRTDALNETTTLNENRLRTDNLQDQHTAHIYGNVGTTTSQSMVLEELNLRKWNIYEHIADMFIQEFCIMIY